MLHTGDGGQTWRRQQTGTQQNLLSVAVVDPQKACAVGSDGVIVGTSDAGQTWRSYRLKAGLTLFGVDFTDEMNGWAVGEFQTVLHTDDGGRRWEVQSGGKRADFALSPYLGVRFLDARHGWVSAQGGAAYWTTDGGKTWTKALLPLRSATFAITQNRLSDRQMDLWFTGENGALVKIPLSDDIPSALSGANLYRPSFFTLTDLAFFGRAGVAVGTEGTILWTNDGGKSWAHAAS